MEEYDDGYYCELKSLEQGIREQLFQGRRHLFEVRMKEERRAQGRRHHKAVARKEPC